MDRFLLMHCFARAVETGSFTAVARELGIGQPNVSRNIAALEDHLGTRLLHRSTRKLSLTPEGERFYDETRRVLDAVAEAESNARGEDKPRGLLRVTCPTSLGRSFLLPKIGTLLQSYPELELDLQISDRFVDLVEEGIDLAIRIGTLRDSALKARRVGTAERVCVASNGYLEQHSAPKTPEDLLGHDCIIYSLLASGRVWPFRSTDVAVKGRFRVNSPEGVYQAVIDDLGIAYAPVWLFEEPLRQGRVQALLTEHMGPPGPIHIVYSAKRLLPRRASVFMDFVTQEIRQTQSLNEGALDRLLASRRKSRRMRTT